MASNFDRLVSKAQRVRSMIQERMGSSGNLIDTPTINRALRNGDDPTGDDFEKDASRFIYFSPVSFFKNHRRNIDEFIEKHITKPIDRNFGSDNN